MSEPHQAAPQPSADPGVAMIDAYVSGDKEGAQRLLDARNARDGIGQATPGNNAPASLPESPPTPEPEAVNFVAQDFRNSLGADGEAIIAEWGGADSPDFAQNIGYMRHAVEHVARYDPGLLQLLTDEVEDEAGNISRLGDNPALIRAAAEYGRLLAHRDETNVSPATVTRAERSKMPNEQPRPQPSNATSIQERIDEIYAANPPGTDRYKSPSVQRQLQALFRAQGGDQPIVGSGGRNA